MLCHECETTDDLLVVGVIDLREEDADMSDLVLCISCLKEKGWYCEEHDGPELVVLDPNLQDGPNSEHLFLMSACLECSLSDAEGLSTHDLRRYTELLSDNCPQAFLDGLEEVGAALLEKEVPEKIRAAFAIIVAARMFGLNLDETVTTLAMSATGTSTRH